MKNKNTVLTTIFITFIICTICMLMIGYYANSIKAGEYGETVKAGSQSTSSKEKEIDLNTDINAMYTDLSNNAYNAYNRYNKKHINFTAKISDIDMYGTYIEVSEGSNKVKCVISDIPDNYYDSKAVESHKKLISMLSKVNIGDSVKISGVVSNISKTNGYEITLDSLNKENS